MDTTRVFAAVEIGEPARSIMGRLMRKLETRVDHVRWTPLDQFHLTLKFLGEVDNRQLPEICQRLKSCAQAVSPFAVEVRGLGSFPEAKPPRVLWAGVEQGSDSLQSLNESLNQSFAEMGFAIEPRRFTPHLTLGRIGKGIDYELLAECIAETTSKVETRFEVDELVLMSSERERGRYAYQSIEYAELA
ncbi:MAG: RNA 2',3'-cyclic phosphodiesterase [Planctomycetota bacterium]